MGRMALCGVASALLLSLTACDEAVGGPHPCEGMTVHNYETPDGCNQCNVCGEDYWGCTAAACSYGYIPGYKGCYRAPCVSDLDGDMPGLQPLCAAGVADGWGNETPMPPCDESEGEPSIPEGVESCFILLLGDDRSPECVEGGYEVEFEVLTNWGGRDPSADPYSPYFSMYCESPSFVDWYYENVTCWGPGPYSESWEW